MKTMKPTAIKTFVVRLSKDSIHEFDIDCDVFSDPYMEAATRAIEIEKMNKEVVLRPVIQCWPKITPDKGYMYNSYWVLVNAGRYNRAELLREKFQMQTKCDLATQPHRGRKSIKQS